jgi:TonB-linked SusC/RagA family outer membrane protein
MTKFYLFVKRVLPLLLLVTCYSMALAQGRTVSGKVTSSDDGSAIPGVNILEKGTSNGTVSDADGNFRISVGDNATLVFSFVGYSTQEVVPGEQTTVNVSLLSDVTALSEVVVVGYGSQEKKELTGAVVSLKSENFNKGNINDPAQLLQGKIAGVTVSKPGSDPNDNFVIRLRGVTSAGASSPLIVVDGVIGASLQNIDPNDIASMVVLKDGSAAAIYGSRGSAGVILITTKKGKVGQVSVDVNSYYSSESIARSVPVMNKGQYVGIGGNDLGSNTNWLNEVTRNGATKVNNIRISGGTGTTVYSASLNFRNVEGILKNSGFDQINGRFNVQQTALKGKVRIGLDMSTTTRKSNYSFQEALRYAAIYNPTAPIMEPNPVGAPNPYNSPYFERTLFDNFNPAAIIGQNVNDGKKNTINVSGKVEVDIIPGLTAVLSGAMQKESEITGQYYSKFANFRGFNRGGLAYRNTNDTDFSLFEGYGIYTKQINNLNFSATAGYSFQQSNQQGYGVVTGTFLSDGLGYNQLQNSQDLQKGITTLSSYAWPDNRIVAFFGRVNFNLKDTYLLSASLRHEGSSRLGVDNRYGDFPAVSGAVILSNLFSMPVFNTLKFRAGYGVTGALPSGNGYSQLQFVQQQSFNYSDGNLIPVYKANISPNPNLKWETKTEINAGFDFGMMKNRLTGSLDVYQRNAKDFILLRNVDPSKYIAPQQYQNIGEIQTRGIELAVTYQVIPSGNFTWSTTLVASHYSSILKSLYNGVETAIGLPETGAGMGAPGQNNTYPISDIAGQSVGTIFGPRFSGQVDAAGSPLMVAADGSLKLSTDAAFTRADHQILGQGLPTLELGWTNYMTFGNFDFNFFLRGSFGHSLVNSWRAFYEPIVPGQINSYNRVTTEFSRSDIKDAQFSSYYVEKAGFLKLDNAALGYNFKFATGSPVNKLRVYVAGNNLFVITNYTGVDPEARLEDKNSSDNGGFTATTGNPLAPGIERRSTYFWARTITVGFNITF